MFLYDKIDFERFRAECAEELNGIPGAQSFGHGDQYGVMVIGLPKYDAKTFGASAITKILDDYKRLMITGKYGRSKTEYARLMEKLRKEYIAAHPELLKPLEGWPQKCFIRKRVREEMTEFAVAEGLMAGKSANPVEIPLLLPEDATFTLPVAYTVTAVENPNTHGSDLLIYAQYSTASEPLERRWNPETGETELVVMPMEEALYWVKVFFDVIAIELQEYFREVYAEAEQTGTVPDYYGHSSSCS